MADPPDPKPFRFSLMDLLLVFALVAVAIVMVKLEIGFLALIGGLIAVIFGLAFIEVFQNSWSGGPKTVPAMLIFFLVVLFLLSIPWS